MQEDSPFPNGELVDAAELGAVSERSVRVWVRRPGVDRVEARLEIEGQPAPVGPFLSSRRASIPG